MSKCPSDMLISSPPPPPPPPLPTRENTSSKPPPVPRHAAIPYYPALSHPVQETSGPPQAVHNSLDSEQDGALPPAPVGPEDGLSDDEKERLPVQETEPATEALGISQVEGQDETLNQMDEGED